MHKLGSIKCGGRNYAARIEMKVILHAQPKSVARGTGILTDVYIRMYAILE